MIGAKTVTSSLLLVVAAILGWSVGLSPARLVTLGPGQAFWAGLFAFLTGSLIYRYWRIHQPSASYFRWCDDDAAWSDEAHFLGGRRRRILVGPNYGDAFDFGPRAQYAIYVLLAFWIGLITLDSRAVDLLASIPARIEARGSEYCAEPRSEAKKRIEMDPGCVLIRRAFEMGYAKSLGACEETEEEKKAGPCTLRQRDEPLLHYAWRRLDAFWGAAIREVGASRLSEKKRAFEIRTEHLAELYDASGFTIASAPRASHHIFTNLPDPRPLAVEAIEKRGCAARYRRLPHRIRTAGDEPASASEQLEHVVAQLLFDTRYARAVGSCREYAIHWDSPLDACDRLIRDPVAFLEQRGVMSEVRGVLKRYRVTAELQNVAEAAGGMSSLASILDEVPPQRFVSFHCYLEEDRPEVSSSSRTLSLEDYGFLASEVRVPARTEDRGTELYHQVGAMLIPTFRYGRVLSDASASDLLDAGVDARFFGGPSGFLSRLDYLNEVDIFLGPTWLSERRDLMDVYPWHVHLRNYVKLFRSRYRAERGRL